MAHGFAYGGPRGSLRRGWCIKCLVRGLIGQGVWVRCVCHTPQNGPGPPIGKGSAPATWARGHFFLGHGDGTRQLARETYQTSRIQEKSACPFLK